MKKKKRKRNLGIRLLTTAVFASIIFSSCENKKKGDWDGTDYYTGKDTVINRQTYRHSSFGYWYFMHGNSVTRCYPNTGYFNTLPVAEHKAGTFLTSPQHTANGGTASTPSSFKAARGGGFGSTSRGSGYHGIS